MLHLDKQIADELRLFPVPLQPIERRSVPRPSDLRLVQFSIYHREENAMHRSREFRPGTQFESCKTTPNIFGPITGQCQRELIQITTGRAKSDRPLRQTHPFLVVFSHSCTTALAENPRNIDDARIKACAARGGVIGLSPWGPMVLKTGRTSRPTLDDFIDHIDHVAQLLGTTENIGLGTDMSLGTYPDHISDPWGEPAYRDVTGIYNAHISDNIRSPERMVDGFSSFPEVLNFISRMKKRGYGEADTRGILGGNYLRVFEQVWS